jgi:hypothetical protein
VGRNRASAWSSHPVQVCLDQPVCGWSAGEVCRRDLFLLPVDEYTGDNDLVGVPTWIGGEEKRAQRWRTSEWAAQLECLSRDADAIC